MDVAGTANQQIWIVTGPREAGKTSYCHWVAADARQRGWRVVGLISPAQFELGQKVGIQVADLASSERRLLASKHSDLCQGPRMGCWNFDAQAIDWANAALRRATPCDLLVVDELGSLEFDRKQGFTDSFKALSDGAFRLGLVVVRSEYLVQAKGLWPDSKTIEICSVSSLVPLEMWDLQ